MLENKYEQVSRVFRYDARPRLVVYDEDIPQMASIVERKRILDQSRQAAAVEVFHTNEPIQTPVIQENKQNLNRLASCMADLMPRLPKKRGRPSKLDLALRS